MQVENSVDAIKFSEDGTLLAVRRSDNLEMWETSTWEHLWSAPCKGSNVNFSRDSFQVLVENERKTQAYNVQSGDALGEVDSVPNSMHDHVHIFLGEVRGKVRGKWECNKCKSFPERGEYWFTSSDRWLWIVEDHTPKRLTHIPEYPIHDVKVYSTYVAIGYDSGLLVLDTARN